jgi:hypothetical protein
MDIIYYIYGLIGLTLWLCAGWLGYLFELVHKEERANKHRFMVNGILGAINLIFVLLEIPIKGVKRRFKG